ncbi:ATP-binding cassette domain-containing protein [Thermaerobacter litoralis]
MRQAGPETGQGRTGIGRAGGEVERAGAGGVRASARPAPVGASGQGPVPGSTLAPAGALRAVDGVDLLVPYPGETVGIAGESGSGKSTLARLILRLIEPTAGSVWMEGVEVTALRGERLRQWRQQAQMVFQDPWWSLDPRQRLGDAVTEPLAAHRRLTRSERRRVAEDLLEQVGLPAAFAARYPHELSGGQRQRVGIARALSVRPKLLILDEPTSALDVSVQAQILQLLEQLREQHRLTYLFISHDLRVLEYLCDRLVVMYRGVVVEEAPVDELFARPRHPYTRTLLAARHGGPGIPPSGVPSLAPGVPAILPPGAPQSLWPGVPPISPPGAAPGVPAAVPPGPAPGGPPGVSPSAGPGVPIGGPVPAGLNGAGTATLIGQPGAGCRYAGRCPWARPRCFAEAPALRPLERPPAGDGSTVTGASGPPAGGGLPAGLGQPDAALAVKAYRPVHRVACHYAEEF